MKTLQEYIIESVDTDPVNEGKVWDAVKKWWKDLFKPSEKKKYDRWGDNKISGVVAADYQTDLNNSFNISNIKTKSVNPSSLKEIVYPQGIEPNKISNEGFWRFVDDKISNKSSEKYYAFVYENATTKDVAALAKFETVFKESENGSYLKLEEVQILKEFSTLLKLNALINYIFRDNTIMDYKKGIVVVKNENTELYEKVVNDCDFNKETINGKNIALRTKNA